MVIVLCALLSSKRPARNWRLMVTGAKEGSRCQAMHQLVKTPQADL